MDATSAEDLGAEGAVLLHWQQRIISSAAGRGLQLPTDRLAPRRCGLPATSRCAVGFSTLLPAHDQPFSKADVRLD